MPIPWDLIIKYRNVMILYLRRIRKSLALSALLWRSASGRNVADKVLKHDLDYVLRSFLLLTVAIVGGFEAFYSW